MPDFIPFQADDFDPISGIDLNFDGDGNLVDIVEEEPQLPPFFGDMPSNVSMPASGARVPLHPEEDFLMMVDGQMLPEDAEAFPVPAKLIPRVVSETAQTVSTTTTTEIAQAAAAPARRRRKTVRPGAFIDDEVSLRRSEQREWAENYVDRMGRATKPKVGTTVAQAKKNAQFYMLDNAIAGLGLFARMQGVAHSLAAQFNGQNILAQLHPDNFAVQEEGPAAPYGRRRRRKSDEAF